MNREAVQRWLERYEQVWRTPGTERLQELFTPGASYLPSPWGRSLDGLDEIARFWESERDSADEEFTMSSDVVAVDDDIAVVRVEIAYAAADSGRWRDLWILAFTSDHRCSSFEEWPFAPSQPDGH